MRPIVAAPAAVLLCLTKQIKRSEEKVSDKIIRKRSPTDSCFLQNFSRIMQIFIDISPKYHTYKVEITTWKNSLIVTVSDPQLIGDMSCSISTEYICMISHLLQPF